MLRVDDIGKGKWGIKLKCMFCMLFYKSFYLQQNEQNKKTFLYFQNERMQKKTPHSDSAGKKT